MAAIEMRVVGRRGFKVAPFDCPNCKHMLIIEAIRPSADSDGHELATLTDYGIVANPTFGDRWVSASVVDELKAAVAKLADENRGLREALGRQRKRWSRWW